MPHLVLADDLSGAAEAAACFGAGSVVRLWGSGVSADPVAGQVCVLDLDTRRLSATQAADVTASALAASSLAAGLLFKKSDSLLRGNVAAELGPLLESGRTVLIAPALPALGRTTRNGVIHINGVPLHETALWAAETRAAPRSAAEALSPVPVDLIPLDAIRGEFAALRAGLRPRSAYVCDAETHEDLARIAALGEELSAAVVGSAGVCRAICEPSPDLGGDGAPWVRPCLTVVGTANPTAVQQTHVLRRESGAALVCVTLEDIAVAATRARWANAIVAAVQQTGDTVVTLEPLSPLRRLPGPAVASALADIVSRALRRAQSIVPDLILTGGETARGVLDSLGVRELTIQGQVEPGAVVSRSDGGRYVATRPGSFGGPDSLLLMRRAINRLAATAPSAPERP